VRARSRVPIRNHLRVCVCVCVCVCIYKYIYISVSAVYRNVSFTAVLNVIALNIFIEMSNELG
jgi:hypothetical protein